MYQGLFCSYNPRVGSQDLFSSVKKGNYESVPWKLQDECFSSIIHGKERIFNLSVWCSMMQQIGLLDLTKRFWIVSYINHQIFWGLCLVSPYNLRLFQFIRGLSVRCINHDSWVAVGTRGDFTWPRGSPVPRIPGLGTWINGHWGPTASGKYLIWDDRIDRTLPRFIIYHWNILQLVFCFIPSIVNNITGVIQWWHSAEQRTWCTRGQEDVLFAPMGPGNLRHFPHTQGRFIILLSKSFSNIDPVKWHVQILLWTWTGQNDLQWFTTAELTGPWHCHRSSTFERDSGAETEWWLGHRHGFR